jgi:hypothetical protein
MKMEVSTVAGGVSARSSLTTRRITWVGSCSSMPPLRSTARAASGEMNCASGRLRQYLRGISFCISASFSRAGLKMLW